MIYSIWCDSTLLCHMSAFSSRYFLYLGRIHLVHLWICKYFTDDSSVNFHDKFFLHFLLKFRKKWRRNLSWKFTDKWSVKYLWIHKWTRWIRPMAHNGPTHRVFLDIKEICLIPRTRKPCMSAWPIRWWWWSFVPIKTKFAAYPNIICHILKCHL